MCHTHLHEGSKRGYKKLWGHYSHFKPCESNGMNPLRERYKQMKRAPGKIQHNTISHCLILGKLASCRGNIWSGRWKWANRHYSKGSGQLFSCRLAKVESARDQYLALCCRISAKKIWTIKLIMMIKWPCQQGEMSYRDWDRLEVWSNKSCMKIYKDKFKVLHLGWHHQGTQYRHELSLWSTLSQFLVYTSVK